MKAYFFEEYPQWCYWIPVFLGLGILLYFFIFVPWPLLLVVLVLLAGFSLWIQRQGIKWLMLSFFFVSLGYFAIKSRVSYLDTQFISQPIREIHLKGTVENIEYFPNKRRALIKVVDHSFLKKVRLRLCKNHTLHVGQTITCIVDLMPFTDLPTPYSFDYKRDAFFKGINATGCLRRIITVTEPKKHYINRFREYLSLKIRQALHGDIAEVTVALLIGDKTGISAKVKDSFSGAGVSHILAISGLHLSLIALFLFVGLRRLLCFIPCLASRYPLHKITAVISWFFILFYALISGFNYPVQRAFIMITFFMLGILTDRTAVSLYSVCLAAFFILLIYPESLISASFQLSFAAVIPLIALYEILPQNFPRWILYFLSSVFSTVVAGLGTLPFVITFFKSFSFQTLLGNLFIIPLFSWITMPLVMLSIFDNSFLYAWLQKSLEWIIFIADYVSHLKGAYISIPPSKTYTFFALYVLGGLWFCLFKTRLRFIGLAVMLISPLFYRAVPPPDLLISHDRRVIVWKEGGSFYTKFPNRGRFFLEEWSKVYNINIQHKTDYPSWLCVVSDYREHTKIQPLVKIVVSPYYFKEKQSGKLIIDRNTSQTELLYLDQFKGISTL